MGDIEKIEVAQLEEELRHLFQTGVMPPAGLAGRGPAIWARYVAGQMRASSKETHEGEFEAVLSALDSALANFSRTRFSETLAMVTKTAEALIREGDVQDPERSAIANLEKRVVALEQRLAQVEGRRPNLLVPIITFAPEPYDVSAPLLVIVESVADQFIATFFDANISSTGDTEEEAVLNLKSLILDVFESLSREDPRSLGPEPSRQLAVLSRFVRAAAV